MLITDTKLTHQKSPKFIFDIALKIESRKEAK